MKIRNRTSEVDPSTTIHRIQSKLVEARVRGITMDYDPDGNITAIVFHAQLGAASHMVRLDPRVEDVQKALWIDYEKSTQSHHRRKSFKDFKEQALRTGWRLLQDWLEVEFSRVALKQGEFEEIFLAHLWDGKQTSYQFLKAGGFKALLPEHSEVPV